MLLGIDTSNAGQQSIQLHLVIQGPSLVVEQVIGLWYHQLKKWLQASALPGMGESKGLALAFKLVGQKWHVSLPLSAHWPELGNNPS